MQQDSATDVRHAIYSGTVDTRLAKLSRRLPGIEHMPAATGQLHRAHCAGQLDMLDETTSAG